METNTFLQSTWQYLKNCPDCWAVIGIGVLLLVIWIAYRRSQRTICIYRSGTGKVHVSLSALHHLVREACSRIGVVHCVSIKLEKVRGKFELYLRVKANLEQNIPDLSNNLHHILNVALGRILGPENVGKVHLVIIGFKGSIQDMDISQVCAQEEEPEEESLKIFPKKDK